MAKGYWVSAYHAVHDPEKLAAYAKLAAPAIEAGGGKFLARGNAVKAYEAGILQRTVIVEFESVAKAIETHAKRHLLFDMAAVAQDSGAMINAVMLGAGGMLSRRR